MRFHPLVILVAATVLGLSSGALSASAAPTHAASASADTCRAAMTSSNWRAVFSHQPDLIRAKAAVKKLVAQGFKTAKFENRGCNDFAIVLESPEFSNFPVRSSFAREAGKAKLVVTYAPPGNAKAKPGDVNMIFGHATTLALADMLRRQVGAKGWRETDILYVTPRDWVVIWRNVPGAAAEATVAVALKAGFAPELELIAH
jgi:hypothetical protein